jgi:hypothetical protein
MKSGNLINILLGAIVIISILSLLRFQITVHSPIIVKLDRLTGQSWVANNGVWMDIKHAAK